MYSQKVADVIVISINYRLGPLGFLCLDTDEGAGNMGMLDQVLALEWVHENIHLFGGDKDRVTIFGESAGAASIGHLVLSKATVLEDGTVSKTIIVNCCKEVASLISDFYRVSLLKQLGNLDRLLWSGHLTQNLFTTP